MAKKLTVTEETSPVETLVNYDKTSLSIVPEGNKRFSLVSIPYNSETKQVGEMEVLGQNLDRFEAESAFKIEAVKRVFRVMMPENAK